MKYSLNLDQGCRATDFLQPSRVVLCTSKNEDGSDHIAPFGWCSPVSQNPPKLMIAIHQLPKKSKTLINIERSNEFVINLPPLNIAQVAIETSVSIPEGKSKFDRSGFTRLESKIVKPVCVNECAASLECKVSNISYTGDHALIIGDILFTHYDSRYFGEDGLWKLDKSIPLIHLGHKNLTDVVQEHYLIDGCRKVVQVTIPKKEKGYEG